MCGWGAKSGSLWLPYRIQRDAENIPGGLPVRVQGKILREEVRIVQQIVFGGAEA